MNDRMHPATARCGLAAVLAVGLSGPTGAATLLVPGDHATIQEAIFAANDGDEIVLVDPLYSGEGNRDLVFAGREIVLRSAALDPVTCRIDCAGAARGMRFDTGEGPATRIEGIEIANGAAASGAGAFVVNGSAPTFVNCRFVNGAATDEGGGVAILGSSPRFESCVFEGNTAENSGGGVHVEVGSPTFVECTFTMNEATGTQVPVGGGMYVTTADPFIDRCVFDDNRADDSGGGLYLVDAAAVLEHCTIEHNEAPIGAGIGVSGGAPRIKWSRIAANTADDHGGGANVLTSTARFDGCDFVGNAAGAVGGGGIFVSNGSPLVVNCVFVDNTALNTGAGMGYGGSNGGSVINCTFVENFAGESAGAINAGGSATPFAANSVFWNNGPFPVYDGGNGMEVRFSILEGGWTGAGQDVLDVDPQFVDASKGDFHLAPGSPGIDRGENASVPSFIVLDHDEMPRFADDPRAPNGGSGTGALVDLGAFERPGITCPLDLDGNGEVGLEELLEILSTWGPCPSCLGDVTDDDEVGLDDLLSILANWGPCAFG